MTVNLAAASISLCALAAGVLASGLGVIGRHVPPHCFLARTSRIEILLLGIVQGLAIATVLGLALGYLGIFSVALWVACLTVIALVRARAVCWGLRALVGGDFHKSDWGAIGLSLAVFAYGIVLRSHQIQAFRDEGIYVATGIHLARTGGFQWIDPLVATFGVGPASHLFTDLQDLFRGHPRFLRLPGFYLSDLVRGTVQPQFLHGYEVWVAAAYAIAGPQAAACVNAAFSSLAILLVFLVGRRLFGSLGGLGGALLYSLNPAFLWYARTPANEPMIQTLIWGVLAVYVVARQSSGGDSRAASPSVAPPLFPLFPTLLPLAAAMFTKFSAWFFLLPVAFDLSYNTGRSVYVRRATLMVTVVGLAATAYLHAAIFAADYLYGMIQFTAARVGISHNFFPVVWLLAVASSVALGAIVASWRPAVGRALGRINMGVWGGILVLLPLVWGAQYWLRARVPRLDLWAESTNLVELTLYLPAHGLFAYFGLVALTLSLARSGSMSDLSAPHGESYPTGGRGRNSWVCAQGMSLLLLMVLGASLFVVRRNLDANHPWAARRWLVILIPFLSLITAYGVGALGEWVARLRRFASPARWLYLIKSALALLVAASVAHQLVTRSWYLVTIPNTRGAIPQVDRWTTILRPNDFVLLQPHILIAQYGAYLKARFNIEAYVQPNERKAWTETRKLLLDRRLPFGRAIYLTEEVIETTTSTPLRLLGEIPLNYRQVVEGVHELPSRIDTVSTILRFYEVQPERLAAGWCPRLGDPVPERPPADPPIVLKMDRMAEPYLLYGFFAPTPTDDGHCYRWTNGTGRIAIGKLLKFPINRDKLSIAAVMHSGRESQSVDVHWYLDFEQPQRARKLGVTTIRDGWETYRMEIEASQLTPESTLDLQSLRPAVGSTPIGRLGIIVDEIRIE
jgi:hypothetical protein